MGGQSYAFTAGSGYVNGTATITGSGCGLAATGIDPKLDVTVSGGSIVNVYASTANNAIGLGIGGPCTFTLPSTGPVSGGTGGAIGTLTIGPFEGAGGIATYVTDSNMTGAQLYDNTGLPGNPLNSSSPTVSAVTLSLA